MLAQAPDFSQIQKNAGITPPKDVGTLISDVLQKYVFYAAGIALLIYLVLGGFQLMFSKGDPKAMEGAKGKITNALIGFVIVVFAYFLVQIAAQVLGIYQVSDIFGGILRGGGRGR